MRHRIYLLLMSVLPLFVGSLATGAFVSYISQGISYGMHPIMYVLSSIVGLGVGIKNIWQLIIENEKNNI